MAQPQCTEWARLALMGSCDQLLPGDDFDGGQEFLLFLLILLLDQFKNLKTNHGERMSTPGGGAAFARRVGAALRAWESAVAYPRSSGAGRC